MFIEIYVLPPKRHKSVHVDSAYEKYSKHIFFTLPTFCKEFADLSVRKILAFILRFLRSESLYMDSRIMFYKTVPDSILIHMSDIAELNIG